MITIVNESARWSVPSWVTDLASFRRWADAEDFPEEGSVYYLKGEVCIDTSKEQVFSHVLVRTEVAAVLSSLVKAERLGLFLGDGVLLSNADADISCKPDATFVSSASLQDRVRVLEGKGKRQEEVSPETHPVGRIGNPSYPEPRVSQFLPLAKEEGHVELEGSPDMVLEVVSRSSVHKDTVVLRQAYWEAGVREYWLVDARAEPLKFDVLRHTTRGYRATPKKDGWLPSAVFGKSFRLTRGTGPLGHPDYVLGMR